ncbi:chromate transporter [Pseudomonas sp. NFPP10]|uniref:chromate efflux transporter n=1 Tax=unclassified Pseudomonas TaxID=196821 RepID=UPI000880EA5A|nr:MULTISPECIES: chromate efflux transporter [unclassified Pseudomonas]SDA12264.1 chromate transporter [Pseudomonas sp. NFPP12]SEK41645.1 chromate transporter [Pseudomonas sp. NFPP10]SEP77626.1 chromate transporter [Pseudomonas sp. NFPP19]SFH99392.1 chromate transporter [Pseudomonas sp. NFPP08]SFM17055.1 chromate transporter [Pseudomonas sp. NFPP05]
MHAPNPCAPVPVETPWRIFLVFLRLGLSSFGGPLAHLGYFRQEFVQRRRWLGEAAYAELVALCQFLPGPASSQVGIALGLSRRGLPGALCAWAGFTLPSALALALLALGLGGGVPAGALKGLQLVAVAVVAQALWGMARSLCRGALQIVIAVLAAALVLRWPGLGGQLLVMLLAALLGRWLIRPVFQVQVQSPPSGASRRLGACCLGLALLLLVLLPGLVLLWPGRLLSLFDGFYRVGALVFGGGHVVLPLLQAQVVEPGWVSSPLFLAGYASAQAMPGPLFSVAAFLGAAIDGWSGAVVCLLAIFLPGLLLVIGVVPFWQRLRHRQGIQAALAGVNAAVVGLLAAALYQPLWTSSVTGAPELVAVLLALLLLRSGRVPPWALVLLGAGAGAWLL